MPDDTEHARPTGRAVDDGRRGQPNESTGEDMRPSAEREADAQVAPPTTAPDTSGTCRYSGTGVSSSWCNKIWRGVELSRSSPRTTCTTD